MEYFARDLKKKQSWVQAKRKKEEKKITLTVPEEVLMGEDGKSKTNRWEGVSALPHNG